MTKQVKVLVIGAGPYGLSVGAYCKKSGLDYLIVGKPIEFWRSNMPQGMLLRSEVAWHIDPFYTDTMEHYVSLRGMDPQQVEPISRDLFLDYVSWFREINDLQVLPEYVSRLDQQDGHFEATLENGDTIVAEAVVVAIGFRYFQHIPDNLRAMLPPQCYSHTCSTVDFSFLKGKKCLIIGGRQSAFEWAALAVEAGCEAIHLSYRHDTPRFEPSDWSWVPGRVNQTVETPDWFRKLTGEQQQELSRQLWIEGRQKLEPWLWPRLRSEIVKLWPNSNVSAAHLLEDGRLEIRLDNDELLAVDHVLLATGYKVDMQRLAFLREGNLGNRLATQEGFPVLDPYFQSNIPGLFFTSLPATRDFGPFFGFLVGVPASSRVIGDQISALI